MPPILATILTLSFVSFLFRRDAKEPERVSSATWIPFLWLFIACSRSVTEWMALLGLPTPNGSLEDGSPIDRAFYITLIIVGVRILSRRTNQLANFAKLNPWLTLFLAYCFLSIAWSDFPFISLKRWIKVLGHPIMALIILTEPNPTAAFSRLVKRCGYILIPISILFIKYYPEYGRSFSFWTGAAFNTGITTDKNMLGINCLILGYTYAWLFVRSFYKPRSDQMKYERPLLLAFFAMNWWLLSMADSKTPFAGMLIGILILIAAHVRFLNSGRFGAYLLASGIAILCAQILFNVYEVILRALGRDPTLTDRTLVWADLLEVKINPIIGTGFESFWLGERLEHMQSLWSFGPNQAHNGYLETYLNLGLVGLLLLIILLVSTLLKCLRGIQYKIAWESYCIGFFFAIVIYNWTEAAFKTTHPIFFMFYIITITLRNSTQMRNA